MHSNQQAPQLVFPGNVIIKVISTVVSQKYFLRKKSVYLGNFSLNDLML